VLLNRGKQERHLNLSASGEKKKEKGEKRRNSPISPIGEDGGFYYIQKEIGGGDNHMTHLRKKGGRSAPDPLKREEMPVASCRS